MIFKKIIAIVIMLVTVLSMAVSCVTEQPPEETKSGDQSSDPNGTTAFETSENGYRVDDQGYEYSELPDKKFDDIISVFSWSSQLDYEFNADGITGTAIRDVVYERNKYLSDNYGITIQVSSAPGAWGQKDDFIKKVEVNQSETGDDAWDAIGYYSALSGSMAVRGFFEDLADKEKAPYLDFNRCWWPKDLLNTASIGDSLYGITGDITPTFIRFLYVMHVNLDMLENYNTGVDIYDLVRKKEWTWEKLQELALGKVSVNGTSGTQEYGFTMDSSVYCDGMLYSAGFTVVENNKDGTLQMHNMSTDQKMIDFFDYMRAFLKGHDDVNAELGVAKEGGFAEGHSMFHLGNLTQVQSYLLEVQWDYGCVPLPMYKNNTYDQDRYYTNQGLTTTFYSVPINCTDYELTSFALEALAWYGYRYMTPTWFRETYQSRWLETPDNAEMFEIIKNSVIFDAGRVFGYHIGTYGAFRAVYQTDDALTTHYLKNIETWNLRVEELNNISKKKN